MGILGDRACFAHVVVVPELGEAQRRPLPQEVVVVLEVLQTRVHHVCLEAGILSERKVAAEDGEDKSAHGTVLAHIRDWQRLPAVRGARHMVRLKGAQNRRKVHVTVITEQIDLAALVDGENARPDVDEHRLEISRGALQQFEHIRKNTDTQREIDGPGAQVQKLT